MLHLKDLARATRAAVFRTPLRWEVHQDHRRALKQQVRVLPHQTSPVRTAMVRTAMVRMAMVRMVMVRIAVLLKQHKKVVAADAVEHGGAAKLVVVRTDVDTVADIPAVRDAPCQTRAGLNSRLSGTRARLC